MVEVVFWQTEVSPHMASLATALAATGVRTSYVASQHQSRERLQQGWVAPTLPKVTVKYAADAEAAAVLVDNFPIDAVHLTQGLWRRGPIGGAIGKLSSGQRRWGAFVETIDERGLGGSLKRPAYAWVLRERRPDFVLAIGLHTPGWIVERGFNSQRVFPFCYFLPPLRVPEPPFEDRTFRIGFVGWLIHRKRVDLLIRALQESSLADYLLVVVGGGPLELSIRRSAERALGPDRVHWVGPRQSTDIPGFIASLDCLVLPSDHDGWGAVVSEALLVGVPVICSDRCGAALAVHRSGVGGVFPAGCTPALSHLLERCASHGKAGLSQRRSVATWAQCLTVQQGQEYLRDVIARVYADGPPPVPPWDR